LVFNPRFWGHGFSPKRAERSIGPDVWLVSHEVGEREHKRVGGKADREKDFQASRDSRDMGAYRPRRSKISERRLHSEKGLKEGE